MNDAISRQAVCKIIDDIRDCISVEGYWAILERLNKLPPVITNEDQEPFKPMVEIDLYSVIKQKYIEREVLDEIRAEISKPIIRDEYSQRQNDYCDGCAFVCNRIKEIINKYMTESEEV